MLARTSTGQSGMAEYLRTGHRQDHSAGREEKDNVIPTYGDLDVFKKAEEYLNNHKNYTTAYTHITVSFSKNDMRKLASMSEDDRAEAYRDISEKYIKHHTSGYDLKHEVIAYAEVHEPRMKEINGHDRFTHIHIGISHLNALSDIKLKTTYTENEFIDDVLQNYIIKTYDFDDPKDFKGKPKSDYDSKMAITRKGLIEIFKDFKTIEHVEKFLTDKKIDFKRVTTKNYDYIKVINPDPKSKNINLRGKGFEHIESLTTGKEIKPVEKNAEYYERILKRFYVNRNNFIDDRRSKKSKKMLSDLKRRDRDILKLEAVECCIKLPHVAYQNKLAFKEYSSHIDFNLAKFYVKTDGHKVVFINKKSNINVIDYGDKITTAKGSNLKKSCLLTLELAEAKGWNLSNIVSTGSEKYIDEMKRQIDARLALKAIDAKSVDIEIKADPIEYKNTLKIERPANPAQSIAISNAQKKYINSEFISIKNKNLSADILLKSIKNDYKLDLNHYEITADNKIKNLSMKTSPMNVAEFLVCDIHLTVEKSIEILDTAKLTQYKQSQDILNMPLSISISKDHKRAAVDAWENKEIKTFSTLAEQLKKTPYSASKFTGNKRNKENANNFNNLLIFDIDNDVDAPQLTLREAKKLMESKKIPALIITTQSHQKEKNGYVADRYRILVPTAQALPTGTEHEKYKAYQQAAAAELGLSHYCDKKALNDMARFYYKSPDDAVVEIVKAPQVFNNKKLFSTVDKSLKERAVIKAKVAEIKTAGGYHQAPINVYKDQLTYADVDGMMHLDIAELLQRLENPHVYHEGDYLMMKTNDSKYSILPDNLAHDFKSEKTFNSVTFLQKHYGTIHLNTIARKLNDDLSIELLVRNDAAVSDALSDHLKTANNDRELQDLMKEHFNCGFCKLESEIITIADQTFNLQNDLHISKAEIIDHFKQNRQQLDSSLKAKM